MTAQPPQQPGRNPENNDLVVAGWVSVFVFPTAALVIGAILNWSRKDERGLHILFAAVALQIVALLIALAIFGSFKDKVDSVGNGSGTSPFGRTLSEEECTFDHKPTAREQKRCLANGPGVTVHVDR